MTTENPAMAATWQGIVAIMLWASLASLTVYVGPVPPFQLAAMTFAVGTVVGFAYMLAAGQRIGTLRNVPFAAWAFGVYGLLAYHVCYFFSLQRAPVLEASLLNYLWPLLIVLFSAALPAGALGEGQKRLSARHIVAAALGFAGTVLILTGPQGASAAAAVSRDGAHLGYAAALLAAVIWASYSVGSRLFAGVPSSAVTLSCAGTAIGAAILHLLLERTLWPSGVGAWAAVLGLGMGPVGLAFYLWDGGMKRGDLRFLGVAAYATPLLSTALLIALGLGNGNASIWIAAMLITAGAALAGSVK